ncbi:MAG TPA: hypothetical protein VFQ72_04135 [Candidatus Paceibacterota bacterium]|nr:hypothetical protein [Candidatus Paceibacterota bacterium]
MHVEGFLADKGLEAMAVFALFAATIVGVAFLNFGGDGAAAFATAEKAREGLRLALNGRYRIAEPLLENGVHVVKQLLGDERLVIPLVDFPVVAKMSVVERVRENF